MKIKLILSLLVALCAALVSPNSAQAQNLKLWSKPGTATSATLSTLIVPVGQGTARVQYVNGTADNATNRLYLFVSTNASIVATATNSTQAIVYAPGITGTPRVAIYRQSTKSYEYGVVSSVADSYITLTGNTAATSVGDIVYVFEERGNIPVGNATKEINAAGGGILNADRPGQPLCLVLYGESAAAINAASGTYE